MPFCLCCLSDCGFVFHSDCQSAVTLSRLFFFLGWAGLDGVRVLRNSSPVIPHCLTRSLRRSQHVHTYINMLAYMRAHPHSSWKSGVFVSLGSGDAHLSPQWVLQWTGSLCLSLSTFTCTHKTGLLREIRIRQGLAEFNYMCLYWDSRV